jgi:DNA-binding XRE family transcriptional regulator
MRTFRKNLSEQLSDPEFQRHFEEEQRLAELSLRIHKARESRGWTQKEAAEQAQITQQQMSKIENGVNCNMITFLKVCQALGLKLDLGKEKQKKKVA